MRRTVWISIAIYPYVVRGLYSYKRDLVAAATQIMSLNKTVAS